jgi:hypothetical protein
MEDTSTITLEDISRRIGISREKLRYVIDQRMLPDRLEDWSQLDTEWGSRGRGTPRRFTPYEAFCVACAAILLNAGLRRQTVKHCLKILCSPPNPRIPDMATSPLRWAFDRAGEPLVEVGDGVHVRMRDAPPGKRSFVYLGWLHSESGARLAAYEPLIKLSLDVAKLRASFR